MEDLSEDISANVDNTTELSDDDLFEIASCIEEVKAEYFKIGLALRLKHSTVDGIRKEKLDHAESLFKVINEWLLKNYNWKKHGKPTWKALVEAVQKPTGGNNTELAIRIATDHPAGNLRNVLNASASGHALASQISGFTSSGASVLSPISIASPGLSLPVSLLSVNSSSSSSPDSSPLGSDVEEDLEQQLECDSRMIQTKYANYVDCIREIVESKGVNPGQLSSFLINLPASNSNRRKKSNLLSHMKNELQKAAEISEIFFSLSAKCASFLDFDIFNTILQKYGSAEKREELEYPSHLKNYLEKLKINEFVRLHPELLNPKLETLCNDLNKIYVKLNIKKTQNLSTIKEVTRAVANILGLKSSALQLCRISKGCVLVTLLISNATAETIFTSDVIFTFQEICQFQEAKVMWLECNGFKFDFQDGADFYTRSIEEDQCFFEIIQRVPISSLKYFGIMLKIGPEKLEQLQSKDKDSAVTLIVKEWFKIPMGFTERLEQLDKALSDLEGQEYALFEALEPHTKHGSSDSDSAFFSEWNTTPSFSMLSLNSGDSVLEDASAQRHTERFMATCRIGNVKEIQCCLQEEIIKPHEEFAALMHAALCGHLDVVVLLVSHGAQINKQDKLVKHHLASEAGHLGIVSFLLTKGADPNIQEFYGMCPLLIGAERNDIDLVKLCLTSPKTELNIANEEGKTALMFAAKNNNFELAKILLHDEFIGRINLEHQEESKGWTALMCAAFYGHYSLVNLLTERGADMNKQDRTGCTALILASNNRNFDVVDILLAKGANPNIQKNDGSCPILIGVKWNYVKLVKLICLSPSAKMNIVDKKLKTPLILAVEDGNIEIVRFLLHKEFTDRIGVEHLDENGRAAIHVAAECGNLDIARLLLGAFPEIRELKDKEGNVPVDIARENKNVELVALFSPDEMSEEVVGEETGECGGNVCREEQEDEDLESSSIIGTSEVEGEVATKKSTLTRFLKSVKIKNIKLLHAAKAGNARKVEKYLKSGAQSDTMKIDTLQWTPLMWACQENHVETVKVLLKYGADPNLSAQNGTTPLILASRQGNHEVVKILLNPMNPIKTDVQMKNKTRGWSALMWACQLRGKNEEVRAHHRKVVNHLLDAGADVNSRADNGWTPIMQASENGNVEIVKILTSHESSKDSLEIDHQSHSTWTALTAACRKKHLDVIKVLVDAGADVNKKKKGGVAPLHITAIKQMVEASDYLIKHGADVNIQDEFAQLTAILFAIRNEDQKTCKLLVKDKARMDKARSDAKEKFHCSPLFFGSKGFERIQMYKFYVDQATKNHESSLPVGIDGNVPRAVYAALDLKWRLTQLPNYFHFSILPQL